MEQLAQPSSYGCPPSPSREPTRYVPLMEPGAMASESAHGRSPRFAQTTIRITGLPAAQTEYRVRMQVVSVQVGSAGTLDLGSRTVQTGIHKAPVQEIAVRPGGVVGDAVMNAKHHGGPDQAVYAYSAQDYAWWERQLDRPLTPGTFGENLTVSDTRHPIRAGDRLLIDGTLLEVTAPRLPCAVFAARMDEPKWMRRFLEARRPGFYCRVLQPGIVRSGDPIEWRSAPISNISLSEMMDHVHSSVLTAEQIRRALASPIAERARARYAAQPI